MVNTGIATTTPANGITAIIDDGYGNLTLGSGARLQSTAGDNFQLFTYTNTPNPNWAIGYGNGAGSIDTTKEYISANAGTFTFGNANIAVAGNILAGRDIQAYDASYSRLFLNTSSLEWRVINDGTNSDKLTFYDGTNGFTAMTLDPLGNLTLASLAGSSAVVYCDYNGTLTISSSSRRYKQNIKPLTDCSWIYNLNPVSFDWIDAKRAKADGPQVGLIAEDVYAVNPMFAWVDKEGLPKGVHYEKLVVPLMVEVKKLKAEIEDLRSEIKSLKEAS
jgi:hypothetical protein